MRRRNFVGGVAAGGAAVATSSFPAPAIAQGNVTWRMVMTWPKNFPGLGTSGARFAERVAEATDGRLTIEVLGAGELVPPLESFDAVQSGAADLMHATPYYWVGKHQGLAFFTTVPFGMTAHEIRAWVKYGGGQELWDELYDGFGLKGFQAGNTGVQMGGWFRKEINSLEDLRGLNMRMPGLGGEMMRRLGVTVVNTPVTELQTALQSGALDATEWVGPFNDLALGLYKVTRYYYWPGVHEPGSELEVTVRKDRWEELPRDLQRIVQLAAEAEQAAVLAEFDARNGDALDTLLEEHGVELRQFPDEVVQAMGEASGEVIRELRDDGDDLTRRIADSFLEHWQKYKGWSSIGERAYMNARALPFDYAG